MKLLYIMASCLCAAAHGANVIDDILPPGISVSKGLEGSQYDLKIVSPKFEESQDIVLSEAQKEVALELNERNIVTGAVQDILDELRSVVINGNDVVPPLDPLVVPVLGPYEYRVNGVVARGTVNNLRMEGLRWFVADRINVNPIRLTFGITITIPSLTITGSYDASARVALLLTHTAAGNFRIFAHRIDVGIDMRMGTNLLGGGHLVLRELDIDIDIHDTHVSITGMTGSNLINSFISSTIQSVSQELIQNELQNVSRLLSEELFDVINDVLKDYTVSDIFG